MKKLIVLTAILALFLGISPLYAKMSGGDYEIVADVISSHQGSKSVGGDYVLESTLGESAAGSSNSGDYQLEGGFWGTDQTITYSLSKSVLTLSFGATPTIVVASDSLTLTVSTGSATGFAAKLFEDGNLRSGANDIDDVTGGAVTAGSEEYGIIATSVGAGVSSAVTTASGIQDNLTVLTSTKPVTNATGDYSFRAAVSTATQSGTYSHTVTFSVTANP